MTTAGDEPLLTRLFAEPGGGAEQSDPQADRILDAALEQFELFGLRRTTIDDVARRAGLGRATIYRRFPARGDLVTGVLLREARRFFAELDDAVSGLPTMADRLVEGFVVTLRISRRQRLINRLMTIEPEVLLPHATFEAGPLIAAARGYLARNLRAARRKGLAGDLDPDFDPEIVAEIMIRLTHSLLMTPEGSIPVDDAGAREFARRYLVPIVTRSP